MPNMSLWEPLKLCVLFFLILSPFSSSIQLFAISFHPTGQAAVHFFLVNSLGQRKLMEPESTKSSVLVVDFSLDQGAQLLPVFF